MKTTTLLSVIAFILLSGASYAANDFGKPFTNEAPAGFSDSSQNDDLFNSEGFNPELIEPAAGDEEAIEPESDQEFDAQKATLQDAENDAPEIE